MKRLITILLFTIPFIGFGQIESELKNLATMMNEELPMITEEGKVIWEKVTVEGKKITYYYSVEKNFYQTLSDQYRREQFIDLYCFGDLKEFKNNNVTITWKYFDFDRNILGTFSVNKYHCN